MNKPETQNSAIETLVNQVNYHNHRYYVLKDPEISDAQYDAIFEKLRKVEADHPELANPNSPTTRVGSDITNRFQKYTHPRPMLSVRSYYNIKELEQKLNQVNCFQNLCIEDKFDGIAIEIEYRSGSLFRALTRGDGLEGEDVTTNIRTIPNIPLTIPPLSRGGGPACGVGGVKPKTRNPKLETLFIRGEVLITEAQLKLVNKQRRKDGLKAYPNTRNAAASLVMANRSEQTAQAKLEAYFYSAFGDQAIDNAPQSEQLTFLSTRGFKTPRYGIAPRATEAIEIIRQFQANKPNQPTDGVVVKIDNIQQQEQLGQNSRYYNWAFALKETTGAIESRLTFIEWSVSSKGYITPIAHFDPITHKGTVYCSAKTTWATLHEIEPTRSCMAVIQIKGDVSAQLIGITKGENQLIRLPTLCPCCKQPLRVNDKTRQCLNHRCPEKTGDYQAVIDDRKTFTPDSDFGTIAKIRAAAAETPALVVRTKKGSNKPLILYRSNDTIFQTLFNAGMI